LGFNYSGTLTDSDLHQIYRFLRSNKVILRTLNYVISERHVPSEKKEFIHDAVARDRDFAATYDFAQRLRRKILHVSQEFSDNKVDIVFIKAFSDFPLDSGNFDILVKEQRLDAAISTLLKQGFRELVSDREPFKWLFRRVDSDLPISVHLHTHIGWENVEFVNADHVWQRYRMEPIEGLNVGFPCAEHHALITASHAFFENRLFALSDLMYMSESLAHTESMDWEYIRGWCLKDNWLKAFGTMLYTANQVHQSLYGQGLLSPQLRLTLEASILPVPANGMLTRRFDCAPELPIQIPTVPAILSFVDKVLRTSNIDFAQKVGRICSAGYSYVKRRMPLSRELPARLICFSGQDGTGKTTHAQALSAELTQKIRLLNDPLIERDFRVKYVWSRGIGASFEPLMQFVRMLLLGSRSPRAGKYATRRDMFLTTEPIRTLWAYARLLDEVLLLQRVRISLLTNQVVVCDRYVYDALVDVECGLGKSISAAKKRVVEASVPTPAVTFLLDANPAEIAERRKDLKPEQLESCRENYRQYLQRNCCFLIDTRNDIQLNKDEITSTVFRSMMMP
jgi:thymidylate kinase